MYYIDFSAQLKKIIDRFYSINTQLTNKEMKTILITSQHSNLPELAQEMNQKYERTFSWWLKMENIGIINAYGVLNGSDLNNTDYLKQAYDLGKSLQEADYANSKIK